VKFSVHIPTAAEGLAHPIPFVDIHDFARIGRLAEELGYDGIWGNYHVTTQEYVRDGSTQPPSYFDTLVVLASLAVQTKRLHLGTALLLPTMQPIPVLAKQAATLDQLSDGRMRLGLGVGAYREEFEAVWPGRHGVNRGTWLDEALEALGTLFRERSASFAGEFVQFEKVESYPKPLQAPLPLFVGGHNLRAIERAARWGHGWLPGWQPFDEMARRISYLHDRLATEGRHKGDVEVAPQLSVTVATSDGAAEEQYWRSGLVRHRQSLAYTGRDLARQAEANLIGSPSTIRDKVRALSAIGVDHCCALWFSTATLQEMLDQMQWFAQEVITPLRAAQP
jgi:probable F420-dependent oxidoreductase